VRKKARLIAKGYSLQEGINYIEAYAPIARIGAFLILLLYVAYSNIRQYKIDNISAFLNGYIKVKVYVGQPLSFENTTHPHFVYKLNKELYGLKSAPRV